MFTEQQPIYLVDGNAYIYRAYHAISPLSNSSGLPTHAIYGFVNILLRVLREKAPRYLAVAFDVRGPNFRHRLYPAYKANRPSMPEDLVVQIPYIKAVVAAYNILCLEQEGVEADDLLAAVARKFERAGHRIVVISGDKDLLQLVSGAVTVWEPMKDKVFDVRAVEEKYKVGPEKLLDLFALMGDVSDNVPGVPGVGPKTAEMLISEYGSLENLYASGIEQLKKTKLKENLLAHRQDAFLSRELIRLKDDLDLPDDLEAYLLPTADMVRLKELYGQLEFTRLLKSEIPAAAVSKVGFELMQTVTALKGLLSQLAGGDWLAIDLETSGLDPLTAELVGISLCGNLERCCYIPVGHKDADGARVAGQLEAEAVLEALRPLLEDSSLPKIGQNLKFDYSMLAACRQGAIRMAGPLWDTMVASYVLDPARRSHKLDDLCHEYLDLQMTTFAEVTGNDKRLDSFVYVTLPAARDYSCEDVYGAVRLWEIFQPRLKELGLWQLYAAMESRLVPILAGMELAGIEVDPVLLNDMSEEFRDKLVALEKEIYGLAGEEFNINSPQQLGEILFEKLNLPHGRKTKTGYSTDIKILERLSYHDLPRAMISYRNLSKLKSTYVDKLASLIHPRSGRVHTSFNQTVTATGRLSSSNPNLQNIPIRTAEGQRIRQAFVPAAGHLFLAGDYSQIDLRVLAHYSQDRALLDAFRTGQDIHSQTAAEIFLVSPLLVTSQMRRVAKTINFGIVYGMSSFGLAGQLNLSRREAQTFIDRYFEHYSGVRSFMAEIVEQARRDGYVTTLLNRRRGLPDIKSANRTRREFAERTAINTPIQGTAADIIKLAMIRVDEELQRAGLTARMLLQIHDELVFEVTAAEAEQTRVLVKKAMESVLTLDVPLVVNMSAGANLAEV